MKLTIALLGAAAGLEKFEVPEGYTQQTPNNQLVRGGRGQVHDNNEFKVYSFDGEESIDDFSSVLHDFAGDGVDELEEAIRGWLGVDRNVIPSPLQERKFRNLKVLVLWLQIADQFGRYCYYGCYCLPEGSHNIAAGGYGQPVDNIDRACFDFKQCYKCLINEHLDGEGLPRNPKSETYDGKCKGENLGYKFDLFIRPNGTKVIKCRDKAGSCKRNICECDKKLAEQLSFHESEWDETKHAVRGGFKREEQCIKKKVPWKFVECCGDRFDFPFNKPRKDNQCCEGPKAKPAGTCSN